MSELKQYSGGCHCGTVRYDVKADLSNTIVCDCSHCQAKGFILSFTPAGNFTLKSGENALGEYRFNKKHIAHLFCKTCGVQSFGRGKGKDGSDIISINARCLDGVDIDALTPVKVNGRSF